MLTYSEIILFPVDIYLFKVNNKITRKQWEKCPKLTKKDTRTTSIDINTQLIDVALCVFLFEFAKSHAMRAICASMVYMPTCPHAKSMPISHFYMPTFLVMLNICKFLEYLDNCRKFILRNEEFKFWQNILSTRTFNFVFNGACEINWTIIWLAF